MSGPITCGYIIAHGILMLSARAIREAQSMKREYGDVIAQLRERERSLVQARQGQRAARLERTAYMRGEAARLAARFERLRSLAGELGAHMPDLAQRAAVAAPVAPEGDEGDEDAAWVGHLQALEAALHELESALAASGAAYAGQVRAALAAAAVAPTLDEVLGAYVLQRQLQPGLGDAQTEQLRETAARVLSRLERSDGAALPAELESLARAIVLAPSLERAEALATELRLAVQRHGEARDAQARDAAEALRLLDAMPEDAPVPLLRALERVAAGVEQFDAALREAAQHALDLAAADREQQEQDAAALVLQESLRDLGYEVEDIGATLFADGGAVHFRRTGWENYFVRLRLDPRERTANFNVVRASGGEESAERRRLDALAEDRWCAEFPRLLQTLAARGLTLDVRRRLEAGEVPVQVVDGASLPDIAAEDDAGRPQRAPRSRQQP